MLDREEDLVNEKRDNLIWICIGNSDSKVQQKWI